jgi:hypothetical protein
MGILWLLLLDPGIIVMMRKMLLGIKQRAEKMHEATGARGQEFTRDPAGQTV